MAYNNKPIFTGIPRVECKVLLNSNNLTATAFTSWQAPPTPGDSSPVGLESIFTANASYGSYVNKIRIKISGGSMSTSATDDTVVRFAIASISTPTGSPVFVYDEIYVPKLTLSTTISSPSFELPMNIVLAPSYTLFAGKTKSTGRDIDVTIFGGDFSQNVG